MATCVTAFVVNNDGNIRRKSGIGIGLVGLDCLIFHATRNDEQQEWKKEKFTHDE